ncbi:unnamed protein product [Orchesella dallaii]|uniref:F-box domain-containing protein n=1 Tax=Orchesella dallaii TaxID=48710 RepID=A0ABP1QA62_9HEXA
MSLSESEEGVMMQVFPFLTKYLEPKDILASRLVCKSLKQGVEQFLQDHPVYTDVGFQFPSEDFITKDVALLFQYFSYDFYVDEMEDLETFFGKVCKVKGNPFLSRRVTYREISGCGYDHEETEKFRCLFKSLLKKFGSQIWHCVLALKFDDTTPEDMYQLARSYLKLMPNLKSLSMHIDMEGGDDYVFMTDELTMFVRRNPLPPLKQLVTLKLEGVINPIEEAALRKYRHVRKLSSRCEARPESSDLVPDFIGGVKMNQLEDLRIMPQSELDLIKLQIVSWKIKGLRLDEVQNVELASVFRAVSVFGKTLRHFSLCFELGYDEIPSYKETGQLKLPQVEIVKITAPSMCISSIDFLLPCISLKELYLNVKISSSTAEMEGVFDVKVVDDVVIPFQGHFDSMNESLIWELFPKLEKLQIKTQMDVDGDLESSFEPAKYEYTRDAYVSGFQD